MDDSIKRHAAAESCRGEGQVTQRMIEAGGGGGIRTHEGVPPLLS